MKASILIIIGFIIFLFLLNIVYEYVHTFNVRKTKYRSDCSPLLMHVFLHIHILNDIVSGCFYNGYVKLKIIGYSIYVFVTFDQKKYFQNVVRWQGRKRHHVLNREEIRNRERELYDKFSNNQNVEVKTIYFIRHSESVWNNAFNKKFNFYSIFNISFIFVHEIVFLFSSRTVLFDSPLSVNGIIQSLELSNFLRINENDDTHDEGEKKRGEKRKGKSHNDKMMTMLSSYDENFISDDESVKFYDFHKSRFWRVDKKNISQISLEDKKKTTKQEMKYMESLCTKDNTNDLLQNKSDCFLNKSDEHYDPQEIIDLDITHHIDILNRKRYESTILCSNLRRTISSSFIGFYNRLHLHNENIYVLDSLKEVSRNPDCVSLLPFYKKYILTDMESFVHKDIENMSKRNININNNKKYWNIFTDTLNFIFQSPDNIFIIFGHSLWISIFFKTFLKTFHEAQLLKLQNSGILLFNVAKYINDKGEYEYEIMYNSIRVLYKDFEEKR